MKNDAISLLKRDHQEVREMLETLAETSARSTSKRPELLAQIAHMLEVHTTLEEEIFYPAFKAAANSAELAKIYYEAVEEHRTVDSFVLPDLRTSEAGSHEFGGRAKVLKDLVLHHAEEEEAQMFPQAERILGTEKLRELGEQMLARKAELEGKGARKGNGRDEGARAH